MRLQKLSDFRDRHFEGTPPTLRTLRVWCENNQLPARKLGDTWFVDLDRLEYGDQVYNALSDAAKRVIGE